MLEENDKQKSLIKIFFISAVVMGIGLIPALVMLLNTINRHEALAQGKINPVDAMLEKVDTVSQQRPAAGFTVDAQTGAVSVKLPDPDTIGDPIVLNVSEIENGMQATDNPGEKSGADESEPSYEAFMTDESQTVQDEEQSKKDLVADVSEPADSTAIDEMAKQETTQASMNDMPFLNYLKSKTEEEEIQNQVDISMDADLSTINAAAIPARTSNDHPGSLQTCAMKNLGLQFSCDLGWNVLDEEKTEVEIVVSEDPLVTMGWKHFDQNVRFLGQLNKFFFDKFGLYESGFRTEQVEFAGYPAVLVKGFSRERPGMQVRDYFYLYGDKLVGISFKSLKGEESQSIIRSVKDSFAKIP